MTRFLDNIYGRYSAEKKTILELCERGGQFAMADLARELGTSIPKVTRIVTDMLQDGYLLEFGKQESAAGRRPTIYGLNPDAGYFVGVDVNRDSITVAVANFSGRVSMILEDIPYILKATEESIRDFCLKVNSELEANGVDLEKVRGYGVNLTGRVNYRTGYSYSYFIGEEKPFALMLEEFFDRDVTLENDSRAMAYGEYMAGMDSREDNVIFLNVGWGLGMGMVMEGRLLYGKSGFSGEIGHFPFLDNNVVCQCGKVGCLETGASGRALHRMVLEKLKEGKPSVLSGMQNISLKDILVALEKEDVLAIDCIQEVGATLGRAVAGLINIFNPDKVVIGGRLSSAEHYFMPPLRAAVNKLSLNLVNSDTRIVVSRLGKNAGAIGASLLSKHRLLNQ